MSRRLPNAVRTLLLAAGRLRPAPVEATATQARAQGAKPGGMLVGFSDDVLQYDTSVASAARALNANAFRLTLRWSPGQRTPGADDARALERAVTAAGDARVVLSVFGTSGADAPTTEAARDDYCAYVRETLARIPRIRDVVVWNEPNKSQFWRPQFDAQGESVAPRAYEALLARCYDVLHDAFPAVNVVAPATSPRGNDDPGAASNVSHSPGAFIRALGEAYRASGRTAPILDTVGHHVYGETSAERPWKRHPLSTTIGEGDWQDLMQALVDAFGGTGQPIPGECAGGGRCVSIWYLEAGYQTVADPGKASLYTGRASDAHPLPDFGGGEPSTPSPAPTSPAPDQATQVEDAVRLAACQPYVTGFFNFMLVDEADLSGWQSGALWPDRTPKDSFPAFRDAYAAARAGAVDCSALKGTRPPQAFEPATTVQVLAIEWPKAHRFDRRNDLWRFRVRTGEDASYRAVLYRLGGAQARDDVSHVDGELKQGFLTPIRFPAGRLAPGTYQLEIQLAAAGSSRTATRTSPTFVVGTPATQRAARPKAAPAPVVAQSVVLPPVPVIAGDVARTGDPHLGAPDVGPVDDVSAQDVRLADPETIEPPIVAAINRLRTSRGLRPLRTSPQLARAGDAHARALALAGTFSHDWPDGRPFGRWAPTYYPTGGYRRWSAGENLLWTSGTLTPEQAVELWLGSPPHRRNMLDPAWREIGVGVAHAGGAAGVYGGSDVDVAAAEFGARS